MPTSILFGVDNDDLQQAKSDIEKYLSIQLDLHDSLYLGGYYYRYLSADQTVEISLRKNIDLLFDPTNDPPEDYWAEPDFTSQRLLLYIEVQDTIELIEFILLKLSQKPSLRLLRKEARE